MTADTDQRRSSSLDRAHWHGRIAIVCGAIVVTGALVVLAGWATGASELTSIFPHLATMKPNTAVGFLLTGAALFMSVAFPRLQVLSRVLSLLSLLLALVTLLEYLLHVDAHIDTALLPDWGVTPGAVYPGRAAPATAAGHLLAAAAALFLGTGSAWRFKPSETLAAATGMIGLTATLGYAFGVDQLYRFDPFSSVALHTALLFVCLAVGISFASSRHRLVSVLSSPYLGGRLGRRLLIYAVIGPIFINLVALKFQFAGFYEREVTLALVTVMGIVATATVTLVTAAWINRADEQRQRLLTQQSAMMRELDHRVKNNLASVLALTSLTINSAESLDEFRESFVGRIRALAQTHEALAAARWEGVRLLEVIRLTIAPYATAARRSDRSSNGKPEKPAAERLIVEGEDVLLPAVISSSVCVSLHELATNAAKYGAFKHPGGQVRITWTVSKDGFIDLEWRETGVPTITRPARIGFGTEMITGAVEHEMQGTVEFNYAPPGLVCRVHAPITRDRVAAMRRSSGMFAEVS